MNIYDIDEYLDYFDEFMSLSAIKLYLEGYGYKAEVDHLQYVVYVQDPIGDTFVLKTIGNWKMAREFIALRSKDNV